MKPFLTFCVAVLLVQLFGEAQGLAYQFEPISRVFAPAGSEATQSFTLTNGGTEPVALTISFQTLERDESYVETNQPADDEFLAYPPQLILAPGAKQKVRVSWLGEPNPARELTYRIVVEQVPIELLDPKAAPAVPVAGQVKVLLNYRGTLFIRPRRAAPKIDVVAAAPAPGANGSSMLAVTLRNAGLAVGTVRGCKLHLTPTSAGAPALDLVESDLQALLDTRILAGDDRRYLIAWPTTLPIGPLNVVGSCSFIP